MINNIKLVDTASYSGITEIKPAMINYFYGSNGSGKTTISNVIAQPESYTQCSVEWNFDRLETLVYNKEFVEQNFSQSSTIKGIFTLGKDFKDVKESIESKTKELDEIKKQINKYGDTINKLNSDLEGYKNDITDKCWEIKKKYQDDFKDSFSGNIGSKASFLSKCISSKNNKVDLLDFEVLVKKSNKVYSSKLITKEPIALFEINELRLLENNTILSSKIVGKEDVQIGELIKKLNNSDWIKGGLIYLEESTGKCPFCQQGINEVALRDTFEQYFDETYELQCKELMLYKEKYIRYITSKMSYIRNVLMNYEDKEMSALLQVIEEKFKANVQVIDNKITHLSLPVTLQSLDGEFQKIQFFIGSCNEEINSNNNLVRNLQAEKTKLKSQVWRFITNELSYDLNSYESKRIGKETGLQKIKTKSIQLEEKKKTIVSEIKEKESQITSVSHTVNKINRILMLNGFTNFKLKEASEKGHYQIIRADGADAKETLSEGEYRFITFLYFYQLIKGSTSSSGQTRDKIVVIDDPISSLDSNVLFIVSTLVKNIVKDCFKNIDGIKQLFILTHNVYFYKEITFRGSRENKSDKETYWIVKKKDSISKVEQYEENPIKTTYQLLWKDLSESGMEGRATVFNTMRRILEYYFNIIGNLNYEKLIDEFEGEEKLSCKALLSCINDGSHDVYDDLIICNDSDTISKYIKVFKLIFEKTGHIKHYNMMTCDYTQETLSEAAISIEQ